MSDDKLLREMLEALRECVTHFTECNCGLGYGRQCTGTCTHAKARAAIEAAEWEIGGEK